MIAAIDVLLHGNAHAVAKGIERATSDGASILDCLFRGARHGTARVAAAHGTSPGRRGSAKLSLSRHRVGGLGTGQGGHRPGTRSLAIAMRLVLRLSCVGYSTAFPTRGESRSRAAQNGAIYVGKTCRLFYCRINGILARSRHAQSASSVGRGWHGSGGEGNPQLRRS
jgi:hypothetical protein